MNNPRIAAYLLPVAVAAALGAGGCGYGKRLDNLEQRMGAAETKPLLEAPIGIQKNKPDQVEAFMSVLGIVAPMYQNGQARATAEARANLIEIYPTNERGKYKIVVGEDVNGDGKLTEGIDFTLADRRGTTYVPDFRVREELLLRIIRNALPHVREYQPPLSPAAGKEKIPTKK